MPTKCCWVIHGSMTSERKASTSPSSFINHSTLLLNRALDRLRVRTRRRVGSARRWGNHMHDHSRFQRDINDVTGVSLSLSLSLSQKSLTHNIGSASALPIIARVCPLHKLSPHDNCSSYDRLSEELVLLLRRIPLRSSKTKPECAAWLMKCWSAQQSCLGQKTLFLLWLNFVTNKNWTERRYDC